MRRRLVVVAIALAGLLALPATAQAHPLGNFTINRYSLIEIDSGSVHVTYALDMAEIPTFQTLGGSPTVADARAYLRAHAAEFAGELHLTVNGRPVTLVPDVAAGQAGLRRGQGGLPIMRLQLPLSGALPRARAYSAQFSDDTFSGRLGWQEIVIHHAPGIVLSASTAATHDVSHMLRHYPKGMLSTPLEVHQASFSFHAGTGPSIDVRANPSGGVDSSVTLGGFTSLVQQRRLSPGFILLAIVIAMFWGAVHALSPGHGKSLVGAYLVGSRGTARHAVFLGATVTVTHTAGVFALGLVALYLAQVISPEALFPWLAVVSGLMVVGVGSAILRRRLTARAGHGHHHHHGPGGHTHVPHGEEGTVTMRSLLALGISGGLLPCPSALVVMLGAIALHRTLFGIVLVIAFSTGLAFTLTSVGLLVLYARRYLNRVPSSGRVIGLMPIASAVVVSCLGVYLTMRGLQTFPDGAPRWLPALLAGAGTLLAGTLVRQALSLRRPSPSHAHHHHEHDHGHSHELAGA
jgi:ABC-type nickel/cobalt efflux system permease component RcnA